MKILQISSARYFGSSEKHLISLCKGLQSRGHDVFVMLRPSCEWKERLDFLPKENLFHVSIRNSIGIFSAQKIAKFVRDRKIELIHAHVTRDYFPASLACRITKTPKFILTRHSATPMKSFHRFSLTNLSKVIGVSEGIKKNLQILFPKEKIVAITNGIEVIGISAEERKTIGKNFRLENNIPLDSFFVGTIGEIKETNGQRDFVLAAQMIAAKFPESRFAIIGKDNAVNQPFRRELKRMVKIFGLEDRFLWLDWVSETANFYNALDVLVSPSHSESFSLATLEAMTNQTAIVATETELSKELLKNNETGLVVPVKEPVQLADAVNRLLADEVLRRELGKKALISAKENFDVQKMIDETEKIYQSLF